MSSMTRGDLKPDLEITISDGDGVADFSGLDVGDCTVICEINGVVVVEDPPTSVTPAQDGQSAVVVRQWVAGETDEVGRMWCVVEVDWGTDKPQTFPQDSALRLDIGRASGDA